MPHIPNRRQTPTKPGYVYLIEMAGLYKIGHCKSWRSRKKGYTGMPYPVRLVVLLKFNYPCFWEKHLHQRYAAKRMHGEWFKLDASDVEELGNFSTRVHRED